MGELEKNNRKRVRNTAIQKAILGTVKVSGLISVALLAPNVLGALKKAGLLPKPRQKEYVSSSASKLVGKGLLRFEGGKYCLTHEGEKVLELWDMENYQLKKPKKWDKKWRVIIFDIPEKKRKVRTQITTLFRQMGLQRLQDSVWVYPYDLEDIIGLLKTNFGVGKDVLYLIVDELENDRHLRHEFGLLT